MAIVFHQARMVLPNGELFEGDLRVDEHRITQIDRSLLPVGMPLTDVEEVIEAEGKLLMPGVIDPQVHFREPGKEHKEDLSTASQACARGGVTSFLEMPNTVPTTTTQVALDDKLARAAAKSVVNYGFFIGATAHNLEDLKTIRGACGIKIFMGSMHGELLVDRVEVLDRIFAETELLIAVHAENQARIQARREMYEDQLTVSIHSLIQDEQAALEATQLALTLATRYRHRLHILHLSTGLEVELLRRHKPAWVTAEVTPQHLLMSTEDYMNLGSLAQMNPPLRAPENQAILWQGLQDGVLDLIATDHAPHTLEEKARPYPHSPSGMPGVETSLPLMLTCAQQGRCSVAQVVRWMCQAPAEAYQIKHKGCLQVGYDADLVLVDLETIKPVRREELLTKCGWSPFEGWELVGWPTLTMVGGKIAFRNGEVVASTRGRALEYGSWGTTFKV